jgi:prenyltransferase beta subunit
MRRQRLRSFAAALALATSLAAPAALAQTPRDTARTWLEGEQLADGAFGDVTTRDTAASLAALGTDPSIADKDAAIALIVGGLDDDACHDDLARVVRALARSGDGQAPALGAELLLRRNSDGGFGYAPGYPSSPIETALSVLAFAELGVTNLNTVGPQLTWLRGQQNSDGGWSIGDNASSVNVTALALAALGAYDGVFDLSADVAEAAGFLATGRAGNGSYGHAETTLMDTALVQRALLATGQADATTQQWLLQQQAGDGAFGDAFTTAVMIELIEAGQPNVRVAPGGFLVSESTPVAASTVVLSGFIDNPSNVAQTGVVVRFYRGHPMSGGVQIGADQTIDLPAGSRERVDVTWDTTGQLGDVELWLVIDPADAITETSEVDNTASLSVRVVLPAPGQVAARINNETIDLSWQDLSGLGATGYNVYRDGALVAANLSSPEYSDAGLAPGQTYVYHLAAVHPDGSEGARSPGYSIELQEPPAGAELFLTGIDVKLGAGSQVTMTAFNAGRTDVTDVRVIGMLRRDGAPAADVFFDRVIPLLNGEDGVTFIEPFTTPSDPGQYTMSLLIDPDDLIGEFNDDNNRVDIPITLQPPPEPPPVEDAPPADLPPIPDPPPDGEPPPEQPPVATIPPEVWIKTSDFATDPVGLFEQTPFTVTGALSNRGGGPGENITVRLFLGDPRDGGAPLGEVIVPVLGEEPVPIEFTDVVLPAGIHELWIFGDADDLYAEALETNNLDWILVEVDGINPVLQLSDLILVSPPAAEKGTELTLSTTVTNRSNRNLTDVSLTIDVTFQETGDAVTSQTLPIGDLDKRDVSFDEILRFTPGDNGVYEITLSATGTNPVDGNGGSEVVTVLAPTREFQVGPFVEGSVTASPLDVAVGDPIIGARVEFGARLATIADEDPLVAAVVEAADGGSGWSASRALGWSTGNNCFGCHVQTQGLVSATLADEVDVDPSITQVDALFSQVNRFINPDGTILNRGEITTTTALTGWALSFFDDTPDDTSCAAGELCGGDSRCTSTCAVNDDCGEGYRCDVNGRCIEAQPECLFDVHCEAGSYCDGEGLCVSACAEDGDCTGTGEVCSARGRCEIAQVCIRDAMCPAGSFCDGNSRCTFACDEDDDCNVGGGETCSAQGRCLVATPACTTSADCAAGSWCDAGGVCQTTCADASECNADETCDTQGRCAEAGLCFVGATTNLDRFLAVSSVIRSRQQGNGSWVNDHVGVSYRTTPTISSYATTAMVKAAEVSEDSAYDDSVLRATDWFLAQDRTQLSDFDAARVLQAFNVLIPYFEAQEDDAQTTELKRLQSEWSEYLVSRQEAGGTWNDDATSGSQGRTITTAVVLFGLASTGLFDREDPTLRSGVVWLLNQQQLDGSWGALNGGNANIDDTTMVMLAIPKIVELLTSLDFELEFEVNDTVTLVSSSRDPASSDLAHGTLHLYEFPALRNGFTTRVDMDLVLKGMEHNEQRPIAERISLYYINRASGDRVEVPLDIPVVTATTQVTVDIDAQQDQYTQGDDVGIDLTVGGVSPGLLDPQTAVTIHDADGELVDVVAVVDHTAADLSTVQDFSWRVPITVIGGGARNEDAVVTVELDITQALADAGLGGGTSAAIDASTIRVYEEVQGALVEVPATFDPAPDFDALLSARGKLHVYLPGETPLGGERHLSLVVYSASEPGSPAAAAVPPPGDGMEARFYGLDSSATSTTSPEGLVFLPTPQRQRSLASMTWSYGTSGPGNGVQADWFGTDFSGYLYTDEGGSFLFEAVSDDALWVFIDDQPVISSGGTGGSRRVEGAASLSAGFHSIRVVWLEATGSASFNLRWRPPSAASLSSIAVEAMYAGARGLQSTFGAAEEIAPQDGLIWESGNAPAGTYTARALFTAGGAPNTTDEDTFELLPRPQPEAGDPNALRAALFPERGIYNIHEVVKLFAALDNPDLAYAYPALDTSIELRDPQGALVTTLDRAFSGLEPAQQLQWTVEHALGAAAAGVYEATLVVTDADSGVEVATAETSFVVAPPDVVASLAGAISATPISADQGVSVTLSSQVGNVGTDPIANVPVEVFVRRVSDGSLVQVYQRTVSMLTAGTIDSADDTQDTSALEPGTYVAVLTALGLPLDQDFFDIGGMLGDGGPQIDGGVMPGDLALQLPGDDIDLCEPADLVARASGGARPYLFSVDDATVVAVETASEPGAAEIGLLSPRAAGDVVVTVTDANGDTATGTLTVPPAMAPLLTTLTVGEQRVFGSVDIGEPLARSIDGYTWEVDDATVAEIAADGTLTALAAGETFVRLVDGSGGDPLESRSVRVLEGGALDVTVRSDSGAPLSGVHVRVAGHEAMTGPSGVASFDSLPTGAHDVYAWAGGVVPSRTRDVEVGAGDEATADVVVVSGEATLRVAVTDDGGTAVAAARVDVIDAQTRDVFTGWTGDDGELTLGVAGDRLASRFFVFPHKDGFESDVSLSRTARTGERTDAVLRRLPQSVISDVTGAAGGATPMMRSLGCDPDKSRLVFRPFRLVSDDGALEERAGVSIESALFDEEGVYSRGYLFGLDEGWAPAEGTTFQVHLRLLPTRFGGEAADIVIERADDLEEESEWSRVNVGFLRIEDDHVVFEASELGAYRAVRRPPDPPPPPPPPPPPAVDDGFPRGGGCLCAPTDDGGAAADGLLLGGLALGLFAVSRRRRRTGEEGGAR